MGLKQRTGQLCEEQAQVAWMEFERVCANDLPLLQVDTMTFHKTDILTIKSMAGLRVGDAIHLACAMEAKARVKVTLDVVLAWKPKSTRSR